MDIGERQRKLSLWAEQDKELRFYDLYGLLYNQDWLAAAHASVSKNAGSATAGTDGINMYFFDNNFEENFGKLREELKARTFEPDPVRRAYIPKSNGKWRPLGIPMGHAYCTPSNTLWVSKWRPAGETGLLRVYAQSLTSASAAVCVAGRVYVRPQYVPV